MAHRHCRHEAPDEVDSIPDGPDGHRPSQPSEETDVKRTASTSSFKSDEDRTVLSLDSGVGSMRLGSMSSQLSTQSSYDPTDTVNVYNMDHARRGQFVIINMRKFNPEIKMPERRGTDVDAAKLFTAFRKLGFETKTYTNLTCCTLMKLVVDLAELNHSDCDCFALAILTHGDEDGVIYGTDGTIPIKKLVDPLKSCPSLAGKPKLFFIQACRGYEYDEGVDVTDAEIDFPTRTMPPQRLPKEADFLYAYSTAPGCYSFRNSVKGSPFVAALARVFEEHGATMDILRMLTRVNRSVAYDYESKAIEVESNRKKQMPSFESMLTKELFFPLKKKY